MNAAREFCAARKQPRNEHAGWELLAVVPEIADNFQTANLRRAGDELVDFVRKRFAGKFSGYGAASSA